MHSFSRRIGVAVQMNTRGIAVEYRLSHWTQIIKERDESGLSIKEYCASSGIREYNYYYWLKKLREAACGELAKTQADSTNLTSPVFAEVKLPAQPVLLPAAGNTQSHICIETAGMRLTAGCDYPIDKLTELLRTVSRICC